MASRYSSSIDFSGYCWKIGFLSCQSGTAPRPIQSGVFNTSLLNSVNNANYCGAGKEDEEGRETAIVRLVSE